MLMGEANFLPTWWLQNTGKWGIGCLLDMAIVKTSLLALGNAL